MVRTSEASKLTCDCGCGNQLTERNVELGRRFLKGHKPVAAVVHKGIKFKQLPPSGVITTSVDSMKEFVLKQRELLSSQISIAEEEAAKVNLALLDLRQHLDHWSIILNSLEQI